MLYVSSLWLDFSGFRSYVFSFFLFRVLFCGLYRVFKWVFWFNGVWGAVLVSPTSIFFIVAGYYDGSRGTAFAVFVLSAAGVYFYFHAAMPAVHKLSIESCSRRFL